jgi:hypothetical protein
MCRYLCSIVSEDRIFWIKYAPWFVIEIIARWIKETWKYVKIRAFWDVAPYSIGVFQRVISADFLHQVDVGSRTHHW